MLPDLNRRIKKIIDEKYDGNVSRFSEDVGIPYVSTNRLFNIDKRSSKYPDASKSNKIDYVNIILSYFNDINPNWLRGYEKDDSLWLEMEGKKPFKKNYYVEENGHTYEFKKEDSVTQQDFDGQMLVEFRDLSVAAGPLSQTLDQSSTRKMLVPREYDRGEYLVVRVNGPSMEDGTEFSIPNGANILIKKYYLENGDKLPIRGNLFVIDAKEGQALKQITEHNTEEGYIICHSYNPEYKDYKVEMKDIYGIYIFRKIIGHRPPVRDIQ